MATKICTSCRMEIIGDESVCPNCGAKLKAKIPIQDLIFLIGVGLLFIFSFLPYSGVISNTPWGPDALIENLWKSLAAWQIVVFVVLILGGVALSIISIVKNKSMDIFKFIVPAGMIILMILQHSTMVKAQDEFEEILRKIDATSLDMHYTYGIGFYFVIISIIVCIVAAVIGLIKNKK